MGARAILAAGFAACAIAAIPATAAAAGGSPVDIEATFALRRDLLAYRLTKGDDPRQACATVMRYLGGYCGYDNGAFVISEMRDGCYSFYVRIEREGLGP